MQGLDSGTGNTCAQSNKCDGVDAVFEVDEATEVGGNVADQSGTGANEYKRYDERKISVCHP